MLQTGRKDEDAHDFPYDPGAEREQLDGECGKQGCVRIKAGIGITNLMMKRSKGHKVMIVVLGRKGAGRGGKPPTVLSDQVVGL